MRAGDPPPPTEFGRPRLLVAALVGAAVLLVAGITAAVVRGTGDDPSVAWDRRLAPLASFVERERGLRFDEAVPVEFLADGEFERRLREESDLDEDERRELEDTAAVLRALGLLSREVDLAEELRELHGSGTLAYYDDEEERIVVKGTELTPQGRSTVVHELTHALQDQHFDLGRLEQLEEDGEGSAFLGLVEGDATRIASAYEENELTEEERGQLAEENDADRAALDVDRFPPALAALVDAPYVLGEPFAETLAAVGGDRRVDAAFRDPPRRDEALLDPLTVLDDDRPAEVPSPSIPDGADEVDDGVIDAFGWYLVLAMRLDPVRALVAADGWDGDRYVAYRSGGRVCVSATWLGETRREADELATALEEWRRPTARTTTVVRAGERELRLQSCEPDEEVAGPVPTLTQLLVVPATRSWAQAAVLRADRGATDLARCYGNGIVRELTLEQLQDDGDDPAVRRHVEAIARACRGAA